MNKKVSWQIIFDDFKKRHPNLSKMVKKWEPHDYLTIIVYLNDGMKLTYDLMEHKATILSTRWKK